MLNIYLDTAVGETADRVEKFWKIAEPYVFLLIKASLMLLIGIWLIKWVKKLLKKAEAKANLDKGISGFLTSFINIILYVILIINVCGAVGIPTASLITILGSCGVAIVLALQGSLQNFAGGVLILIMKPFAIGDYIIVGTYEGFVIEIDICYTKLRTFDNRIIVMPNGSLSSTNLVNFSREPKRRVSLVVPISYSDDIKKMRDVLIKLAKEEKRLLPNEPVTVNVKEFGESSINLNFWIWCKTADYWPVYFDMMEKIKYAIDENGFTIPFTQVDVHMDRE